MWGGENVQKVFPVSWLSGDKSAERVKLRGVHFSLNSMYIKTPFWEQESEDITGCWWLFLIPEEITYFSLEVSYSPGGEVDWCYSVPESEGQEAIDHKSFAFKAKFVVFPWGDSISEGLELPVNVKMGTVNIAKKCREDFFRNIGVVPVEIKELISMVFKRSRPASFTFSKVDFGAGGRFVER